MTYSRRERECLSATHACEQNRLFLYGRSFTLINDNKDKEVEVNALETQVNQTINYAMPIALTIDNTKKGAVTDPVYLKLSK